MISRMVLNNVRNKLEQLGFEDVEDLFVSSVSDEVWTLKCYCKNKEYIIRFYNSLDGDKIASKYLVMEKFGIDNINHIVENNMVIFEQNEDEYREVFENDLKDENVIKSLANWYKRLHSIENFGLKADDNFTKENILEISENFGLKKNESLVYIYNNFDNIKLKLSRLDKVVVLDCFSLEHLRISGFSKSVIVSNFDCLKIGNRYKDLRLIFNCLDEKSKNIFLSVYGKINEEEILLDRVYNVVVTLYLATREKEFPDWAKESLAALNDEKFLCDVKCLVEWC